MMPNDVLIRNVPSDIRQWLRGSRPVGTGQQEYLLGLLRSVYENGQPPSLFEQLPPPAPTGSRRTTIFRFVDLFAGIGGFRIAMTMLGGECVFTCEWDRFSQRTYHAWYGEDDIWPDINDPKLNLSRDIPDHDVLCAGFPCQPFSIAGVSKKNSLGMAHGFECQKQGNLFFRICEVIDAKRPPVLFLENVKNLKSHDKGKTWRTIEGELKGRRYKVFPEIIDAQGWVPQHRERIFIVCFDIDVFGDDFDFRFPEPPLGKKPVLGDILESSPDPKYTLTDHLWNYLQRYAEKHRAKGNGFGFGLVGPEDVTRTLSARYYKDGSEILIRQEGRNPRRLTHREAARLMGYTDEYATRFGHRDGFPMVVSDTQGYKQFGNSVVPKVVEAVGQNIVDALILQARQKSGNGCLLKRAARLTRKAVAG
jgi:DNA (cytosine-5)-methyltransferase 1